MHLLQLKSLNTSSFDEWQVHIICDLRNLIKELEISVDETVDESRFLDKIILMSYIRSISSAIEVINLAIQAAYLSKYTAVISNLYEIAKKLDDIVAKGGPQKITDFTDTLLERISSKNYSYL